MYYLCNGFIYCPVGTRPAAANVASAKREGMKKLVCLFLLLPLLARAGGQTPEVTESDKKGSEFVSNIRVTLNATYEQACLTLDKFVRQYKYSLDSLFHWALRGMKLKGEKDDMISINLKTHTCAEGSDHVDGVMDLYVSILRQDFHDTTYDVSWDIRQSGVDLQVMASGAFVASAKSDSKHCRITLRKNASYSIYVEAMSEGRWKRSDNYVDVSTYGLPSISCESSEVTHPSSHGDVSTVTIDVSFVGTIPPDAKSLSVIVRTKRSEMDTAPWASQGDARSSESHIVDVSTYQRTNVMSVSLSCGTENAYYVTAFVIYRNGQVSSPIKKRIDRPLSASIFWKVTKGLFGGARLSVDMEASRPVGIIPSLVLCVSRDGGNVLSPSSRNAAIVLTTKKKMIAASTAESFSIDLPKQDVRKGDRVFLFQGDDDDDRFALRWASGFNGRL